MSYDSYYDPLSHDGQLLYLVARHFPERAARITAEQLDAVVQPIFRGTYNTFSQRHTRFWPGEDPIGHPVGLGQGGFGDRAAA